MIAFYLFAPRVVVLPQKHPHGTVFMRFSWSHQYFFGFNSTSNLGLNFFNIRWVPESPEVELKQIFAGCVKSAENEYLRYRFRVKVYLGAWNTSGAWNTLTGSSLWVSGQFLIGVHSKCVGTKWTKKEVESFKDAQCIPIGWTRCSDSTWWTTMRSRWISPFLRDPNEPLVILDIPAAHWVIDYNTMSCVPRVGRYDRFPNWVGPWGGSPL